MFKVKTKPVNMLSTGASKQFNEDETDHKESAINFKQMLMNELSSNK